MNIGAVTRMMLLIVCIILPTVIVTGQASGSVQAQSQSAPVGDSRVTPGVAEDPTEDAGETTARQVAADQVGACETFGGTATVIGQSTGNIDVRCTGGDLDGMVCRNSHYDSACTTYRTPTDREEDPNAPPTGGVVFVEEVSLDDLDHGTGDSVTPETAEDPTGAETVVIANQVGHPVDQAEMQKAFCRVAGGKAQGGEPTRNVQEGLTTAVGCKGGLLDGMTCANTATYSICLFRGVVPEDPRVTPSGGIEVPTEDAPAETTVAEPTVAAPDDPTEPTVAPTVAPAEPTVAPTDAPLEPTAAPTEEPVLPTVPTDDNAVPPGEAEDPTNNEPAPTEAPLR